MRLGRLSEFNRLFIYLLLGLLVFIAAAALSVSAQAEELANPHPPSLVSGVTGDEIPGVTVVFMGHLESFTTEYLVVDGAQIYVTRETSFHLEAGKLPEFVIGEGRYLDGKLVAVAVGPYDPTVEGVVDAVSFPNLTGEYSIVVNGRMYRMSRNSKLESGPVREGDRVVGTAESFSSEIARLEVVPPFPLDAFTGHPSQPWIVYAVLALWFPVILLIVLSIMGKTRQAEIKEANDLPLGDPEEDILDEEELAAERELVALEALDASEAQAMREQYGDLPEQLDGLSETLAAAQDASPGQRSDAASDDQPGHQAGSPRKRLSARDEFAARL